MSYYLQSPNELYHHGILGMRWGIRRFQPYPKGHRGGKEVGEAAKAKTDRREGPSKVKITAQKIKEVVKTPEFQTAAIVVGMGAAAAVGSAFISGPVGKALLGTSIRAATNLMYKVDSSILSRMKGSKKVEELAMKQASYAAEKMMEEPPVPNADLSDDLIGFMNSDLYGNMADVAMKVASTRGVSLMTKMQSDPQAMEATRDALSAVAEKYAADVQLTGDQIQKGMEMAQKFKA